MRKKDKWGLFQKIQRVKRLMASGYEVDKWGNLVHRAVCKAHWGPFPKDWVVHHIDENKKNNTPENLIALPAQIHNKVHQAAKQLKRNLLRSELEMMLKCYVNAQKAREPNCVIVINSN